MTARDTSDMLAWNPGDAPGFEVILSMDPCTYRGPRYQDVPVAFNMLCYCLPLDVLAH